MRLWGWSLPCRLSHEGTGTVLRPSRRRRKDLHHLQILDEVSGLRGGLSESLGIRGEGDMRGVVR